MKLRLFLPLEKLQYLQALNLEIGLILTMETLMLSDFN